MLPSTLLLRSALLARLEAGAAQRLTVVVGSAGAGKSVLLSSWAAARDGAVTSWWSCDEADADPVRFWAAFIEAPRAVAPGFGADAAELLAMDGVMSADVTASIAGGFLDTVVTTVPQVTRYLVEHSADAIPDPFLERITGAALEVRVTQPGPPGRILTAPLTDAELRILKLLPTTSYAQIAAALYISHNTVKTHLRSIYQKLGASSRSGAIQRAVELRLL